MDIVYASTTELAAAIRSRDVSAAEVLEVHLAQIARHHRALNAVVTLDAERARERALDREGLPIGVQLVGKRWGESRLLAIAKAVSDVSGPIQRPPGY